MPGEAAAVTTSTPVATKVASTAKKATGGRQTQANRKSNRTSSVAEESAGGRLRSCDDANSSMENSGEPSEVEEEQSESDYSDFSVSESDNDRDSDLDFSVNDLHSRRTRKKRNKRNATKQAKKLTKKQQRETAENTPDPAAASDDTMTPTYRKRANSKIPKKQTSGAKASPATPNTTPRPVGRPATIKKDSIDESTPPAVTVKQSAKSTPRQEETAPAAVVNNDTETSNKLKPVAVVAKAKEKKTTDALFTDMSSLFSTPDIIKKVDTDGPKAKPNSVYTTLNSDQMRKVQQPPQQIRYVVRNVKLASEQDKQLDLIDSLVQEELSKDSTSSTKSSTITTKSAADSHIPNIVKMLETPPSAAENTFAGISNAITTFAASESEEARRQKKSLEEEKLLADDMLDGFANSDDCLTEDLLQHVAQLVEDKNLQEVIDQQVLGLDTPTSSTAVSPVAKASSIAMVTPKPNVRVINAKAPVTTPIMGTPPISASKEPIKIVRSNGRVITLPPIEAPTTRGAKRRAENPAVTEQQQKQRVLLNSLMDPSPVTDVSANTIATLDKSGNIIAIVDGGMLKTPSVPKERRASVSVAKRASIDTPKRKMSVSLPVSAPDPVVDDDDEFDDHDGSDGSYNSEDDPLR